MAYEPKTEAGKAALAAGADADVIKDQEESGEIADPIEETKEPEQKPEEKAPEGDQPEGSEGKKKDEEEEQPVDRIPQSIPAWKAKEMAKEAAETARAEAKAQFDQQLAVLGNKPGGASDEEVKKMADEIGLSEDTARAFIDRAADMIGKRIGITKINESFGKFEESTKAIAEQQGFEKEWGSKKTQDTFKALGITATPEVKAKLHTLAYDESFAKYRLEDIVRLNPTAFVPVAHPERRSAESGRGGASQPATTLKNLDDLTPDQINDLSDAEFDKLSTDLAGGHSRFTRITQPKKGRR